MRAWASAHPALDPAGMRVLGLARILTMREHHGGRAWLRNREGTGLRALQLSDWATSADIRPRCGPLRHSGESRD